MDDYVFLSLTVGVSVGVGFIAAAVKHGREMRVVQQRVMMASMESTTRLMQAALSTLIEDYKVPESDAVKSLFTRAEAAGIRFMKVDPTTGDATPVSGVGK